MQTNKKIKNNKFSSHKSTSNNSIFYDKKQLLKETNYWIDKKHIYENANFNFAERRTV